MSFNEQVGTFEFLKAASYLINELHPLYINIAQGEIVAYRARLFKQKKINLTIQMYEKVLSRTVDPLSSIATEVNNSLNQGKEYAEMVVELYRLFIALNESRVSILKEYQKNGMSDLFYSMNDKSQSYCKAYDVQFLKTREATNRLEKVFDMLGISEFMN